MRGDREGVKRLGRGRIGSGRGKGGIHRRIGGEDERRRRRGRRVEGLVGRGTVGTDGGGAGGRAGGNRRGRNRHKERDGKRLERSREGETWEKGGGARGRGREGQEASRLSFLRAWPVSRDITEKPSTLTQLFSGGILTYRNASD